MRFSVLLGIHLALIVIWRSGPLQAEQARPEAMQQSPVVQLYTMGVGETLFERFGHAAMCLHSPRNPSGDLCFNYGTTDFQTPVPLTWNFLRGRARFWVSTATPSAMVKIYRTLDRTIWRQDLPLTEEQSFTVARRLLEDSHSTKGHYVYHHFHDNCSTRLRDIIDDASNGVLSRGSEKRLEPSYRDLARRGLAEETWLLLATDLTIGREIDQQPSLWDAMFLPEILRDEVQRRFGIEPVLVYERRGRRISQNPRGGGRWWFFLLALMMTVPIVVTGLTGRYNKVSSGFAAILLGLLGGLLYLVAFIGTLTELRYNEALLIFIPTDLLLLCLKGRWRRRYLLSRVIELLVVSLFLVLGFLRQPLFAPLLVVFVPLVVLTFFAIRDDST